MAHTRAFTTPLSDGQKVPASSFNALDNGQFGAIRRDGTTTLTANCVVTMDGHDLDIMDGVLRTESKTAYTTPLVIVRTQHGAPVAPSSIGFDTVTAHTWIETATGGFAWFPLDNLIDGATLTGVTVVFKGGTFIALPGTMPSVVIRKKSGTTAATSTLATTTDTSADVAAFNAVHSVTSATLSEVVNESDGNRYYAEINGAGGINYVNNSLEIVAIKATFSVTTVSPGGLWLSLSRVRRTSRLRACPMRSSRA